MTGFFKRLKEFGIYRIIKSRDFVFAVILLILLISFTIKSLQETELIINLLGDIINASITIATIILAGLAIVISLTDRVFIALLHRIKVYSNVIFIFEYTTILSLISFLLAIFLKYVYFNKAIFYVLIFFFIYTIFSMINLITFMSYYGLKNSEFVAIMEKKKASKKKKP